MEFFTLSKPLVPFVSGKTAHVAKDEVLTMVSDPYAFSVTPVSSTPPLYAPPGIAGPSSVPPSTPPPPAPPATTGSSSNEEMRNVALTGTNGTDRVSISLAAMQAAGGAPRPEPSSQFNQGSNPTSAPGTPPLSGGIPASPPAESVNQRMAGYGSANAPRSPVADLAPGQMLNVLG